MADAFGFGSKTGFPQATAGSDFRSWITDYAPSTLSAYRPLDTPCPRALLTSAFADLSAGSCPVFMGDAPPERAYCICTSYSSDMVFAINDVARTRSWFCGQGVLASFAIASATQAVGDLCDYLTLGRKAYTLSTSTSASTTMSTSLPTTTYTWSPSVYIPTLVNGFVTDYLRPRLLDSKCTCDDCHTFKHKHHGGSNIKHRQVPMVVHRCPSVDPIPRHSICHLGVLCSKGRECKEPSVVVSARHSATSDESNASQHSCSSAV